MSPLFCPAERTGIGIKQELLARYAHDSHWYAVSAFDAVGIFRARLEAFQEGMPNVSSAMLRCKEGKFEHRGTRPGQKYH
jgi:hypothetical protein